MSKITIIGGAGFVGTNLCNYIKKSMAYIRNFVAFLEACIKTDVKYGLYNYVDTPKTTMHNLVCKVCKKILGKNNTGMRIPYRFALIIGHTADIISKILGKKLLLSAMRVKKFTSQSEFQSVNMKNFAFKAPYTLNEGIDLTLNHEFISLIDDQEIFYTE